MKVVRPIAESIKARECISNTKLGEISIIGTGMQTRGLCRQDVSALSEKNINIHLITTSEIRITCIVDEDRVGEAVRALHRAFELEKPISGRNNQFLMKKGAEFSAPFLLSVILVLVCLNDFFYFRYFLLQDSFDAVLQSHR